jgi:hypothetical protein
METLAAFVYADMREETALAYLHVVVFRFSSVELTESEYEEMAAKRPPRSIVSNAVRIDLSIAAERAIS